MKLLRFALAGVLAVATVGTATTTSAGVPVGLQNASFETPLNPATDWTAQRVLSNGTVETATCAADQRSVCVVGTDSFTDADKGVAYTVTPRDGTKMLRLGGPFTSKSQSQQLDKYVVKQTFIVNGSNPVINLNFNAFMYDYTGYDDLTMKVSLTDENGAVVYSKSQGAFGNGGDTNLKSTGWVGNKINLSALAGQQVNLNVTSGGTKDTMYGWWVYLDAGNLPASAAVGKPQLPNTVQAPDGSTAWIQINTNESGQIFITVTPFEVNKFPGGCLPLAISVPINGGGGVVSNARILLKSSMGDQTVDLEDPDGDGIYSIKAGQVLCAREGNLFLLYDVTAGTSTQSFSVPLGTVTLIDPQGVVYDQAKYAGKLSELGSAADCIEETASKCASDKTTARAFAAISGATATLQRAGSSGFTTVLEADPGIKPNVNPQITNGSGRFQWDVAAGTYRVQVTADGYSPVTSREVVIPPPVLDLHIAMTKIEPQTQAATFKVAKKIAFKGKTVLLKKAVVTNAGQTAKAKVTWSTKKSAKGTSKKYAKVTKTSKGKVTITTKGKAKKLYVKLTLKAPATTGFTAFTFAKTWKVKK
ncbi:MAG: carboxypeptidase-like regulatory domain-containing protein [Candidatus Nanopelagicales bacterium]|jgi:hypothetical protein|nr:carboxypeptidase-like regulatory domain-containing protein [Candidatus Nanopelagicales bacterium]